MGFRSRSEERQIIRFIYCSFISACMRRTLEVRDKECQEIQGGRHRRDVTARVLLITNIGNLAVIRRPHSIVAVPSRRYKKTMLSSWRTPRAPDPIGPVLATRIVNWTFHHDVEHILFFFFLTTCRTHPLYVNM